MLSLQTRQRHVLRVEGVAVPGLEKPEDPLLPPGGVQLAHQVVPGIISTRKRIQCFYNKIEILIWSDSEKDKMTEF